MNGYDRDRGNPFGRGWGGRGGYGAEYRPARWGGPGGPEGGWSWRADRPRTTARGPSPGGYDRGIYGGSYPTYGGYPGAERQGMHYGGRYDSAGYRAFGFGPRPQQERGHGGETFLPESAYRRHPELDQPPRRAENRSFGDVHGGDSGSMDDRDIRDAVRHNLFNDTWLQPRAIEVRVNDGVVTLTGEVDDYMEARYAWDDAWEAAGVRGVLNQLTVRNVVRRESELEETSGGRGANQGRASS
jgi:hypothetical protein